MSPSNQARIAALPAHLQELARRRLAGRAEQSDRIAAADHGGPLPLSFAQQRLWFLSEFEPGSAEYVTPLALRLRGDLDIEALRTALTGLVARHESLRTTFDEIDGHGVQVVHEPGAVDLPVEQLTEAELNEALTGEAGRPFDLRHGPLLRLKLFRLAPDEHVLLVMMHHIITDGWSTGVIVDELSMGYAAALRGEPADLPPLPVQYPDYAAWQRDQLAGPALEQRLEYWRR